MAKIHLNWLGLNADHLVNAPILFRVAGIPLKCIRFYSEVPALATVVLFTVWLSRTKVEDVVSNLVSLINYRDRY